MSEEETAERADRNKTFEIDRPIRGNRTGDLPEFFNVTPLDVNATNEIDSFYFYETEQFTVLWLLFAMIVVGNIAVLIGLQWGKRRKTRMDFFIKQLAFAGWRARALVVAAWGLSALFSVPIIFLYEEKRIQGKTQCWIDLGSPMQWRIYMSLVSFTLFIAPTLIIGGCYAVIVATIWSQGGALRQGPTRDTRRASSRGLIPRAKVKTVKMTLVIVFVFILCWSPYIVFDLLQVYGYVPETQTNIAVATFIQSLTPLNSAANPIIYCLFSTSFCKTVRNIQAISWVSGWCATNPHHCFGTGAPNSSTRTTVTTSLTAQSSRRSGHIAMLHSTTRKRVMVSLV
ncbi:cardioacceleratory peptide receptor isoform X3 [Bombus vosnesenskii]|uniref:Cardioacceleratory peptide receptor isoform X3 n=2 Tax=Pyrobombus TaxID=144703 RepID=A0A6J3LLB8_9HYME|nr:cardioacceleratory peptide receptor isoform X3 [Bombus bifarius]XP_033364709.1 cardioacceleratory peptide receptor isoform X3 [Bombus vosnesenskii]